MKLNKHLVLCASLLFFIQVFKAQDGAIGFSYDAGGNLTERRLQVMPGGRIGKFNSPPDTLQHPFKVYPNPTSQYLSIEGALPENVSSGEISLMSINGQILRTDTYTGQLKTLPVADLKPGLYLLQISYSKKQKSTYKIIVN